MRCRTSLIRFAGSTRLSCPSSTRKIYPSSLSSFCGARSIEDDNTLSYWTPRRSFQTYISQNCQQQQQHNQRHQTLQHLTGENQKNRQRYFSSSTATEDDEEDQNNDNKSNNDDDDDDDDDDGSTNFPSRSPSSSTSESDVIDFEVKRRRVADVPIREVLDVSSFHEIYEQYISCYSALQSDYIFKNFTLFTFSRLTYVFFSLFSLKIKQNKTKQTINAD
jgi:hypothetical protein